ncbi:GTP-binding protein [Shewanella sp. Isolate11]|uniref:CobW family GTP-binding protein n=1 Tax=Shewanella sp. Isolate11 TaxID=2908530 RepID=UPI001EFD0BCC|nr:GTP-binding protein [Shewanella sp. Isolate11]MCG9697282.1 GTP-binding protein [Shewanella sp. Isolate11]
MIFKAIPTHVITGFLGVGKTSFIQYLLANKPEDEVWAVLVNEFGEIGIDASLLGGQKPSVAIKEVAGGCICCAAGVPTQVAVNQLIAKAKPDRLFIEPTGLGHPKAILDTLSQPHFQQVISLKSTFCLVDPRKIADSRYRNHDTFNQQLEIADLILATKKDLLICDELQQLQAYLDSKNISTAVEAISLLEDDLNCSGESIFSWLSREYWQQAAAKYRCSTASNNSELSAASQLQAAGTSLFRVKEDQPNIDFDADGICHKHNQHDGRFSAGWVFDCHYEFNFDAVMAWVKQLPTTRLKAVLICDEGIAAINRIDEQLTVTELDDAMDSRLELITDTPIARETIQQQLLQLSKRFNG